MRFAFILAAIVALSSAEVTIEDAEEVDSVIPEIPKPTKKASKPKLTPEELAEKRMKKKKRDRRIESCFVLTRSYYMANSETFNAYIKAHRSTQETDENK